MIKKYEITLKYTPPTGGAHQVLVAGTFNDWQKQEMQHESGNYVIKLQLPAGKYPYKFLIDGHWVVDETADFYEDDQMGGRNSVLLVKDTSEPLFIVPVVFRSSRRNLISVAIAGSFNEWNMEHTFLQEESPGIYRANLLLTEGEYQYKFVLNRALWQSDTADVEQVPDDRGGYNSLLKVDGRFRKYSPQAAEIFTYNLIDEHYPLAETLGNGMLRIGCRTYKDNLDAVTVKIADSNHQLKKFFSDDRYDYYSLLLPEQKAVTYHIFFHKRKIMKCLNPLEAFSIKKNPVDLAWLQNSVIYQIFCDRFCNGDTALNPDFSEWYYDPARNPLSPEVQQKMYRLESNWENYQILKDHPQRHHTFYAGDLAGVKQKLPYLKELGITCIYFNPLVMGASNHKYDTFDYLQVDPHFGGNELFRQLVQECHQKDISIILDFAFNHVGTGFFAFQDCLKKGKNSKYYHWFDWYKFPLPKKITEDFPAADYYQCWWGHATLPDLNFDLDHLHPDENYIHDPKDARVNQPLVAYLLQVAEFWLSEMDIDGFRLDVPNEVPFWYWKLFRQKVKSLKPKAYLVGEIWQNAEEWLGKYFDAVMNYSFFREPVLQFFALRNWTKQQFWNEIIPGLHKYGFFHLSLMMNLLDSHDTHRFLEACNGDFRKYKLALLFQFGWIGVPHLFYGDEVGMLGGNDPDNRRPMNWNYSSEPDLIELHDFVRILISIRRQNPSLIYGDVAILKDDSELLIFRRSLLNNQILIIINNSETTADYFLPDKYLDLISAQKTAGQIQISAFSGVILQKI